MVTNHVSDSAGTQNQLIERVYRCTNLVSSFSAIRLSPPESTTFIKYREDLVHRRVLDLGCGAGRLSVYLRHLVSHYTGLDISPFMIEHCRNEYPGGQYLVGDMRDLSAFPDCSFDTVLGVSNVFDVVSHADRLQVLSEVRRLLVPAGLLYFSAHNRNFEGVCQGPQLEWVRNPLTQIHLLADYRKASRHHRRLKLHEQIESEYAVLNDSANNFESLHYYIQRNAQIHQLENAGFMPLECLDTMGRTLSNSSDDSDSSSIHYLARRRPE